MKLRSTALALTVLLGCRSSNTPAVQNPTTGDGTTSPQNTAQNTPPPRVDPPTPGPARDVHLPPVRRTQLANGLEVNTVEYHTLPVLHVRLIVRAGASTDPQNLPGLAAFTGDMLKEGTRTKTSAQIAEAIEFVGGSIDVSTGPDFTSIAVSVLKDHAETAFTLLGEVLTQPSFPAVEIDKLRRRELDRLHRAQRDPAWLGRRTFYSALYGANHPYGRYDTTPEALGRINRNEIVNYHRARYVAGNMTLTVVGDVQPANLDALLGRTLGQVRRGTAPAPTFPAMPELAARQIYLVNRPDSAQSVIRIGNPSLRRRDEDYVPFSVVNQSLGGGASSRLFMDLRELRSLTYGAYANTTDNVEVGAWVSAGSVRTPATGDALHAFLRHIECAATEAAPDAEMAQTRSYLIDSFPLSIETPGNIADLVASLRSYGLPDDYYDQYRTRVAQVDGTGALAIAQRYIHPDKAIIVVVGTADAPVQVGPPCQEASRLPADASFAQQLQACAGRAVNTENPAPRQTMALQEVLRTFGPVRVLRMDGTLERELTATPPQSPPIHARCDELTAPALQRISHSEAPQRAATAP